MYGWCATSIKLRLKFSYFKLFLGQERSYCTIFTPEEELSVVRFIKNKNRCLQGINEAEVSKLLLDILRVRDYTNKKLKAEGNLLGYHQTLAQH